MKWGTHRSFRRRGRPLTRDPPATRADQRRRGSHGENSRAVAEMQIASTGRRPSEGGKNTLSRATSRELRRLSVSANQNARKSERHAGRHESELDIPSRRRRGILPRLLSDGRDKGFVLAWVVERPGNSPQRNSALPCRSAKRPHARVGPPACRRACM